MRNKLRFDVSSGNDECVVTTRDCEHTPTWQIELRCKSQIVLRRTDGTQHGEIGAVEPPGTFPVLEDSFVQFATCLLSTLEDGDAEPYGVLGAYTRYVEVHEIGTLSFDSNIDALLLEIRNNVTFVQLVSFGDQCLGIA